MYLYTSVFPTYNDTDFHPNRHIIIYNIILFRSGNRAIVSMHYYSSFFFCVIHHHHHHMSAVYWINKFWYRCLRRRRAWVAWLSSAGPRRLEARARTSTAPRCPRPRAPPCAAPTPCRSAGPRAGRIERDFATYIRYSSVNPFYV